MKRRERLVRRLVDKVPSYVGAHSADWFEAVLSSPPAVEPEFEQYVWIEKKCADAFCNQSSGHTYGPGRTRCDNEMFPVPHWERERIGFRAKGTGTERLSALPEGEK